LNSFRINHSIATLTQLPYGELIEFATFIVFFGNKNFLSAASKTYFPNIDLTFLQQTHSSHIVPASPERVKADGHWTFQPQLGLAIITADCLPVFLVGHSRRGPIVLGIHAGWKGLIGGILAEGVCAVSKWDLELESIVAFVGPHIHEENFQFSKADAAPFQDEARRLKIPIHEILNSSSQDSAKCHIKLAKLAQHQLTDLGILKHNIWCSEVDTFSSSLHHSYRRNPTDKGRQISFASIKARA
jgi:YfiH family protein